MIDKDGKIPSLKNLYSFFKETIHVENTTLLQSYVNTWKLIIEMYTDTKEIMNYIQLNEIYYKA